MSEYQYYEWQTVDRLLTEAEQATVCKLSSHIEVSSSRAVVTYSYGDFKHDPRTVLARFFDAHLYLANWGSRRLLFRFPVGLVSRDTISPYCVPELITFGTVSGFDILEIDLSEEEGGDWVEAEGSLSGLLSLRSDIIQGDYRSLYLAWLKAQSVQDGYQTQERKSHESKPPVPAGLKQLSPALKRFVQQFDVPAYLIEAASEHSPALAKTVETDFRPLAAQLTRDECDGFLCRFAQGDTSAGTELKRRLLSLVPPLPSAPEVRIAFDELVKRSEALEAEHKERRKQEARKKHEAEMKDLAVCEADVWRQVVARVDTKQTKGYEEAVLMLKKLAQLAEFNGSKDEFRRRVAELCERYSRLPGFQSRVQQAKLGQ
ncbi:MAG: hypothetical protein WCP12_07105 [bacterium]